MAGKHGYHQRFYTFIDAMTTQSLTQCRVLCDLRKFPESVRLGSGEEYDYGSKSFWQPCGAGLSTCLGAEAL